MSETLIPMLDLRPEIERHRAAFAEAFERVLDSGRFVGGPEVEAFEAEVAEYLGVAYAVGLNSGTDALVIALRALGIGPGDEVITTPFTFFATAEAISQVGARPVFVDVEEQTFNIDPDLIEPSITERTRAILPVHLYGRPAAMTRIIATAERHGLAVVEDCAQSFGARYHGTCVECGVGLCESDLRARLAGRQTGTLGTVGTFSFFPSKPLGAFGDGGLLTTADTGIADAARALRQHGGASKYHNERIGYNSRLDAIQAAFLRVKLSFADAAARVRREVAVQYTAALRDIPGVVAPEVSAGHVVHQYTVRVLGGRRDAVAAALRERGISTMVYYPVPLHRLPVYTEHQGAVLPVTDRLSSEVLSLPLGPNTREAVTEALVAVTAAER